MDDLEQSPVSDGATRSVTSTLRDNLAVWRSDVEKIRAKRGISYSIREKYCIAHVYRMLQIEAAEYQQKHPERGRVASDAQVRTAALFGVSKKLVAAVLAEWNAKGVLEERVGRGNHEPKDTRIPEEHDLWGTIRDFVFTRRKALVATTARDVLAHLQSRGYLRVKSDPKSMSTALRRVQEYLKSHGSKRGAVEGKMCFTEREDLKLRRAKYIDALLSNRAAAPADRYREVYLDESYIHHHYRLMHNSLFLPSDEHLLGSKRQLKGSRYCFAAAIIGVNPTLENITDDTILAPEDGASLLEGSIWIFKGGSAQSAKDCHKLCSAETFIAWFRDQLLPSLPEGQKCMIMMDNAAYHLSYHPDIDNPLKMTRRGELVEYLEKHGLCYGVRDSVVLLKDIARQHFKRTVLPACEQLASERGHKLLLTPPHHSDLLPIELVWANVQRRVASHYHPEIKSEEVQQHLRHYLRDLSHNCIEVRQTIRSIDKELSKYSEQDREEVMCDDDEHSDPEYEELSEDDDDLDDHDT